MRRIDKVTASVSGKAANLRKIRGEFSEPGLPSPTDKKPVPMAVTLALHICGQGEQ
jgi:hypothetical protein